MAIDMTDVERDVGPVWRDLKEEREGRREGRDGVDREGRAGCCAAGFCLETAGLPVSP